MAVAEKAMGAHICNKKIIETGAWIWNKGIDRKVWEVHGGIDREELI